MMTVVSLVYQPAASVAKPPYRYNREPVQQVELVAGHGIQGDFKAGRNPKRHINILSSETNLQLAAEGFFTEPGQLGEQIVIRGLDVATLEKGDVLCLGDSAQIEITSTRTPCDWFELVQSKTIAQAKGRIGKMARVIASGTVHVGDAVRVFQQAEDAITP
jgi:MOSC domain-containing protein YiiM